MPSYRIATVVGRAVPGEPQPAQLTQHRLGGTPRPTPPPQQEMRLCCGRNLSPPAETGSGAPSMAIQGRGARSGRERRSEIWLGAQTPPRPHGEADADAGWRGTTAPRRPRAADASQAASAISVFAPAPDRAHADRARENPRESAADSRKQARRPAQGARTAKRQGVTAISRLPNPRDARRNARSTPNRRAPGIGRISRVVVSG